MEEWGYRSQEWNMNILQYSEYDLMSIITFKNGKYFIGKGRLSGTDSDNRNVIESTSVRNGGRRKVSFYWMRNYNSVHLLGDQVVTPANDLLNCLVLIMNTKFY